MQDEVEKEKFLVDCIRLFTLPVHSRKKSKFVHEQGCVGELRICEMAIGSLTLLSSTITVTTGQAIAGLGINWEYSWHSSHKAR